MKICAYVIMIVVGFSAHLGLSSELALGVPLVRVIVSPTKYDDRIIATTGFLVQFRSEKWPTMNGGFFLFPTKEYSQFDSQFSLIVVDSEDVQIRKELESLSGSYVVLEGRFSAFIRDPNIITVPPSVDDFGSGKLLVREVTEGYFYKLE